MPDLPDVPDVPDVRQSIEDLRGLSDDLEVLVRAAPELVALRAVIDAGLRRAAVRRVPGA